MRNRVALSLAALAFVALGIWLFVSLRPAYPTVPASTEPPGLAPPSPSVPPSPSRRVRLSFDEQRLSDRARTRLYEALAESVAEPDWPTLRTSTPTSIDQLLDDYFDIYAGSTTGAAPRTYRALRDLVADANSDLLVNRVTGRLAAGEVKLPPVPMRAFTDYRLAVTSRLFDPAFGTYELRSNAGTTVETVAELPLVASRPGLRRGRITEVVLSLNNAVIELLRSLDAAEPVVLVDADQDDGLATVTFATDPPPGACNSPRQWLNSSPYHPSVKTALTSSEIAKIEAAAQNVPLTIVDWNVADPKGHGAKVRAVVTEVLNSLGLQSIDQHVQTIELNPASNRTFLATLLASYKQYLIGQESDLEASFDLAEAWVAGHTPASPFATTQKVPSLVLQAIFWNQFPRPRAINLSFTTDSSSIAVLNAKFMDKSRAFAAFAAGNDGLPVMPSQRPQADAHLWPNVVNVTNGWPDGVIDGNVSNGERSLFVNVVAPGCGFSTPPIVSTDHGSSFASPYVLTAAWVRMLQGVPLASVKGDLIGASQPLSVFGRRVQSGGLFDPSWLLLRPGSHIVTPDGRFVNLSGLTFEMKFLANGNSQEIKSPPQAGQTYTITFEACQAPSGVCTTVRTWEDGVPRLQSGPVSSFTVNARSGQPPITAATGQELLDRIRLLTF